MSSHEHHLRQDLESGRKVTGAGMAVNALLILLKVLGGIFGGSRALLADAAHSVSDFVSDVLILIGLHFFHKEGDSEHPYGHGKIETLVTLGVGVLLLAAAARIGVDAVLAINRGEITIPQRYTILIAALGIVSKEILYHATVRVGKRIRSEAVVANAWHHRSDAWTSAVALIGIALAVYVPKLRALDSYAALLVSFFIVKISVDIMHGAIRKIIDTSPPPELVERIRNEVENVTGVKGCHDLTARYYADMIRMEVHVEVDPTLSVLESHRIADEAARRVKERFEEVSNILVHIDPYGNSSPPATGGGDTGI
jgi:cation diffusion facilitator family transporter